VHGQQARADQQIPIVNQMACRSRFGARRTVSGLSNKFAIAEAPYFLYRRRTDRVRHSGDDRRSARRTFSVQLLGGQLR
jgi:hypothetical protein